MITKVEGIEFKLLRWDFLDIGQMGGIYYLVPKDVYSHECTNGAYIWEDALYAERGYDVAKVTCPNFVVDHKSHCHKECDFHDLNLCEIIESGAKYINSKIRKQPVTA